MIRLDTAGREVTDLSGLWDESDTVIVETAYFEVLVSGIWTQWQPPAQRKRDEDWNPLELNAKPISRVRIERA